MTEAVKVIPNKEVIFLFVEDAKTVFIANKEQEDIVYIELDMCGKFDIETKRAFSKAACPVITRIVGTPPAGISMRISEHSIGGTLVTSWRQTKLVFQSNRLSWKSPASNAPITDIKG